MVEPIKFDDALEQMEHLLEHHGVEDAAAYLLDLHPADGAEILVELEPEVISQLTEQLAPADLAGLLEQMDEDDMADVVETLNVESLANVLDEMEPDMAVDLLGELEDHEVSALLEEMEDSSEVESLLEYDPDSAGGIMNTPPPCLRRWMTVAEAVRFIKENYDREEELYYLYVLDRHGQLLGVVNLRALILAEIDQNIEEIMNRDVLSVNVAVDQEEVAQVLARYNIAALPVTDDQDRLVGIITHDDIVDVLEAEATEDIYRLAQVSEDAEVFSPLPRAVRTRLPWLYINLGTAILSASIVTLFEGTIARAALLAAFMPIVAAQGGNAGNQTMTIMVRSLALGEIDLSDAWRALRHELLLGMLHGLVLGGSIGLLAWLWQGNYMLGAIIGVAMISNLIISALVGVLVPLTLKRIGVDPALASGVFVTATTDVMGFAIFLGLATYFLAWLV